jgi:hypothetical protein
MPSPSDPDLLVLLGLRLRSFAPAAAVAETAGLAEADTEARLQLLAQGGLARFRDGRTTGWMPTPEGRTEGEARLAAELDATGTRAAVDGAYRRFLTINQRMLDVCTDWQLRPVDGEQVVNDHTDADHDQRVVTALAELDGLVQPIVADLAEALERFGGYGPRLAAALTKVQGGETDWFTKPTIDSYHTVWFELHENLLATLGIERGSEPTPTAEEAR